VKEMYPSTVISRSERVVRGGTYVFARLEYPKIES
jgi:hypothetical protein